MVNNVGFNIYKNNVTPSKQCKWQSLHLGHNINNIREVWYNIIRNQFEIFAVISG